MMHNKDFTAARIQQQHVIEMAGRIQKCRKPENSNCAQKWYECNKYINSNKPLKKINGLKLQSVESNI